MKTVAEVYAAYRIMPGLQMHQMRVAAVGQMICEHFSIEVDTRSVILACFFHDMGNIIKSDLVSFPEFLEPQGKEYWQKVKDEYVEKYGPSDEHHATVEICREIGLPERVIELVDGVGFSKLEKIRDSDSMEQKIVEYADARVAPRGILSYEQRQADARERYAGKAHSDIPLSPERYAKVLEAGREIERQIFSRCSIKPEDITDESVAPLIMGLREFPIETSESRADPA